MRRSIRSSLFLLVAPFALTFTLVAWAVSSKIRPWLEQPLVAECADKGYSDWLCNLQDGLMPWLLLGAAVLILLAGTATLSLGLFRAHLKGLQQDVLDYQKGHCNTLAPDAPKEMEPLVQLLNRILQAGAGSPQGPTATHTTSATTSASSDQGRHEKTHSGRRTPHTRPVKQKSTRPPVSPTAPKDTRPAEPSSPPKSAADRTPSTPAASALNEELEASLKELDADIENALREDPPEADRPPEAPLAPSSGNDSHTPGHPSTSNTAAQNHGVDSPATGTSRNLAFPTQKCRKLIALLTRRYPDVNFDLITDVAESDPWSIREAELTEIFGHLLDNAGRWAESQVNIFLAIKGNMLVFGVADDGPGVDAEFMPHLGEAGFHASPNAPSGEGLIAVRRSLDAHGGSLAFDQSRLGGLEVIAAIPGSPLPRQAGNRPAFH